MSSPSLYYAQKSPAALPERRSILPGTAAPTAAAPARSRPGRSGGRIDAYHPAAHGPTPGSSGLQHPDGRPSLGPNGRQICQPLRPANLGREHVPDAAIGDVPVLVATRLYSLVVLHL